MIVQIILTTAGANTGPNFDLYSDVDSYEIPFETSVPKAALVAGYISNVVPNGTTVVRVVSFGTCNTAVDINILLLPVTTTTTTTWPVPIPTSTTTTTTSTSTTTTTTTSTSTSTTTTTSTTSTSTSTTTTTTTAAPTTTTTTTTSNLLNFTVVQGCAGNNQAYALMSQFSGGSGQYYPSVYAYYTEAEALNEPFDTAVTLTPSSVSWGLPAGLPNGIFWVAIQDKNNLTDKRAKSFEVTGCGISTTTTTTTTTQDPGAYWNAQFCTSLFNAPILRVPSSAVSGQVIYGGDTLDSCATLTTPYVGTPPSYVDRRTYPLYANCIACNELVNSRWATMVRCDNPAITAYSKRFNVVDFNVNDIVADDTVYNQPPFYTYRITSISTDSANFPQRFINPTGLSTCPSESTTTTTTTTVSPYPCTFWTLTNYSPDFSNYVDYTDCDNNVTTINVQPLTSPQICVKTGTTPTTNAEYISLVNTNESCVYCLDCYVYEYINTSGNTVALSGTLCNGGSYSTNVGPSGEGTTFCLQQYSQSQINAYAANGLTLTRAITPCGNSCVTTTTTTTTIREWYNIINCNGGGTDTSTSYPVDTYNVNDRVGADGGIWRVTSITNSNPGGSNFELSPTGLTGCPTTTTTTTTAAPTLEWYTISSCVADATDTSTSYPINTYEINDRVGANGFPWRVIGISNTNPGGSNFVLSNIGGTGCPFVGCIKWTNEFDYSQEVTCTDPFTSVTSSGTDVYYRLTASLFELDGVTPKNAPLGGVIITFGVSTSGSCSTGSGGTYVVTIPEFTNSVVAPYQQTNYSECGYGCGYNTFTPFQLEYTNYQYVNECPA
jgi:hypothetical protein